MAAFELGLEEWGEFEQEVEPREQTRELRGTAGLGQSLKGLEVLRVWALS